ncbi:CHASE2 domain-containing protein [Aureimonas pseudogalii]|uniref:Adenylate cyclase n=1 Tax=Aureimonas pseudogalii TaxID=1744844 RepID=A0A7W6MM53_9HYPH|nr:adenylate/guanylate cyclase domain-containing protein [Aureimonas pseudogalii]MBB4000450.1 adenylate cyclase [Aureimonas pseudogalii]
MKHSKTSRRATARTRKARLVWLAGLPVLAAVVLLAAFGQTPLERLTPLVFDAYQRALPREQAGASVVVVDVDEVSIARLGQWPWSRAVLARMVDRLGELGAAAIAFDMVFPEPDRTSLSEVARALGEAGIDFQPPGGVPADNDALLADAFSRHPVVAGIAISNETRTSLGDAKSGFSFGGADPRSILPPFAGGVANLPKLTAAATGLGFFSFPPSRDGIVRSLPLVASAQGQMFPALGLEALRVAQGAGSFVVRTSSASGEADTGTPAIVAVRAGALDAPTGPGGEFNVYFSKMPEMATIPAADILSEPTAALSERIAGHIVLVGTSAVGLRDLVATPVDAAMPGVNVHAEMIDQIVGGQFLQRPDWARGAETTLALAGGLLLLFVASRRGAVACTLATMALAGGALAVSWFSFSRAQLLVDPILPLAALAAAFAVVMPLLLLLTDREKQFVRGAFGRYLSPTLVERLAEHPGALRLGGEIRDLTVLFSDIRGFTGMSEALDPQELTGLLNDFLTPMTDVLLRSEATIDKYMGDAIMAFWNAPLDIADHRRKACLAALDMLAALDALNRERSKPLRVGIGLHAGSACVGNLGSAQRFSYSAIGDTVNLASRVEGLTKGYGVSVLVTDEVQAGAPELAFLEIDRVRVVGRAAPVPVFTLLGGAQLRASAAFETLASAQTRLLERYRAADPAGAEEALHEARATAGDRLAGLYDLYEERIALMRQEPPAPDWDGVFVSRTK